MAGAVRIDLAHIHLKNTRSIVHRTALQTCERKHCRMEWLVSGKRLVFRATGTFVADKVRVSAAETCRTYRLVSIHHDVVLCRLCHSIEIVVVEPLAVMMLASRNHVTDITAFYGVITIFIHKIICGFHVAFIITDRTGCFVVHHESDTFGMGIFIEHLDVEIRIGCNEIEHIVF